MSKRLLVTADDFGMCHAVNAGTLRAMREGIVASSNFLVPCPWFNEALVLAQEHALPIGVHLCVTSDWDRLRWGPLTRGPSLTDEQGHFFQTFAPLLAHAKDEEIFDEYLAQVARVRQLGFEPTHLDSHMLSSHDLGAGALRLKALMLKVAEQCRLPYLYETDGAGKLRYFDQEIELSGAPRTAIWQRLAALGPGTYHLIGHAAEPSPELEAMCSPEHPSRRWAAALRTADAEFFNDPATRARLQEQGFELIAVADL